MGLEIKVYYDDLSFTYRGKGQRERERERERGWDMRINDIYFLAKYTIFPWDFTK